jgi:hypothetical protein
MRLRIASLALAIRSGNLFWSVSCTATSYKLFHSEFDWPVCMGKPVKGIVACCGVTAQFHESCKGEGPTAPSRQQMNRLFCSGGRRRRSETGVLGWPLRLLQARACGAIGSRCDLLLVQALRRRPALSQVSSPASASMPRVPRRTRLEGRLTVLALGVGAYGKFLIT